MSDTYTIIEPDGNGGWQVATVGDVRCARLAPSREHNRLIPPAWIRQGYQPDTIPETEIWEDVLDDDGNVTGRQPTGTSQRMTPDFLVGKKFARDIDGSPTPGAYEKLGDWPDEPDSIDTEEWTATWVRPVIVADDFDPATHHAPVWDADAGEWLAPVAKTTEELAAELAARKTAMKAAISARRWEVETGGIVISGASIATDTDTQSKLSGALQLVQDDAQAVIDWKCADGSWVQLDATAVTATARAVGVHVQACFTREKEMHAAVDAAETHDALDLIDVDAGAITVEGEATGEWPSNA